MKHCISIVMMSQEEIVEVVARSLRMAVYYMRNKRPPKSLLEPLETEESWFPPQAGYVFTESSSRTIGSLREALERAGFRNSFPFLPSSSSQSKGEPPTRQALTALQQMNRLLCFRTKVEGVALQVAQHLERHRGEYPWWYGEAPIINGGDGEQNHPTQIILDLVAILINRLGKDRRHPRGICRLNEDGLTRLERKSEQLEDKELKDFIFAALNGLKVAMIGDIRHSRVVNSWLDLTGKFNISFVLVAPPPLQINPLRLAELGEAVTTLNCLKDAAKADVIVALRLQRERLEEQMTVAEAESAISPLRITRSFMSGFKGIILHPQPLDDLIASELWDHPQVITEMQAEVGPSTRIVIADRCWQGRHEHTLLLTVPVVKPRILAKESIRVHRKKLRRKHGRRQKSVNPIDCGTVLDRLPAGDETTIDLLLERAGVYGEDGELGAVIAKKRVSKALGRKGIIFLEDIFVPHEILAALMLVAPQMRVVELRDGQYRKMEFKLPSIIASIFACPNESCITRVDPEAEPFFEVISPKGRRVKDTILRCSFCRRSFTCEQILRCLPTPPFSKRREFLAPLFRA